MFIVNIKAVEVKSRLWSNPCISDRIVAIVVICDGRDISISCWIIETI